MPRTLLAKLWRPPVYKAAPEDTSFWFSALQPETCSIIANDSSQGNRISGMWPARIPSKIPHDEKRTSQDLAEAKVAIHWPIMCWARRFLVASPFVIAGVLNILSISASRFHLQSEHLAGYGFLFAAPWGWLVDRGWFENVHSRFLEV